MTTVHASSVALEYAIGKVVNALTECAPYLCLRYRAEVLALSEDGLLKRVSWFHRLHIKLLLPANFKTTRFPYPQRPSIGVADSFFEK